MHGKFIDLKHFVNFARRVANSQSFIKGIRTNSDGSHSAGPEACGAFHVCSLRDGTHGGRVATVRVAGSRRRPDTSGRHGRPVEPTTVRLEWSAHEPAGLRQGLEQSVIDVVKHDKDVAGLADKDATLITFGRTLHREHHVSSELWQKMIGHFGRQHTVQLMMMIMGDYFRVGFMMNAVDQHLPPERHALLPPLTR